MLINYSDQEVLKNQKSIFLAGPTPRGENAKSWRTEACKILEELGFDGIVYVPEYSTWKPKGDYVDQAQWERDALSNASVIAFWVPRTLYRNLNGVFASEIIPSSVVSLDNLFSFESKAEDGMFVEGAMRGAERGKSLTKILK